MGCSQNNFGISKKILKNDDVEEHRKREGKICLTCYGQKLLILLFHQLLLVLLPNSVSERNKEAITFVMDLLSI